MAEALSAGPDAIAGHVDSIGGRALGVAGSVSVALGPRELLAACGVQSRAGVRWVVFARAWLPPARGQGGRDEAGHRRRVPGGRGRARGRGELKRGQGQGTPCRWQDDHGGRTRGHRRVTNGDPNNDVVGNILTFGNDVFDAADTHKVGTDQGSCIRIVVGQLLGVHVDHVPAIRPDHRRGPCSATRVTPCSLSPEARARTATLAARWSSNTTIRKGRSSTSSSTWSAGDHRAPGSPTGARPGAPAVSAVPRHLGLVRVDRSAPDASSDGSRTSMDVDT